jgi:hypothetical protein
MDYMFRFAEAFNQPLPWEVSKVVSFFAVFGAARAFNQDISSWSVGVSCDFTAAFADATSFDQNLNSWEQQLVGKACGGGDRPRIINMFIGSGCPVKVATIPGDFCQVAPSAMPSGNPSSLPSSVPSMPPSKGPTRRPTKKPTKHPAFYVRVCLADAVKHCSCKKKAKKNQCFNDLTTACKAKYVAAGGAVNKFTKLAKAAARRRKCDNKVVSG